MHIPSLVKIHYLLKLSSRNEYMDMLQADNSRDKLEKNKNKSLKQLYSTIVLSGEITLSKIDEIYPIAIPNQISIMSMHIPGLKIH